MVMTEAKTLKTSLFLPFLVVLIAVVLSPLPLGSNRPPFDALLALLAGTGLLGWGYRLARNHIQLPCFASRVRFRVLSRCPLTLPAASLFPVLVWIALQPFFIGCNGYASLGGFTHTITFLVFLFLAFIVGQNPQNRLWILRSIAFSTALYALYGLATYADGNTSLLWFDKWSHEQSLTGTFVNRNSFAAYAGMGLMCTLALMASSLQRALTRARASCLPAYAYAEKSRTSLFIILFVRTLFFVRARGWLLLVCALILCETLILSDSRAGVASVIAGAGVLWVALMIGKILDRRLLVASAIIGGLVLGILVAVMGQGLLSRFDATEFLRDERLAIWAITIDMIRDAPLTGQGYGQFAEAFASYRVPAIEHRYTEAHSTYLEMMAEIGLPASALWFLAFVFAGIHLLRALCQQAGGRNTLASAVALAVLAQAGMHALVDFSFQIPANAVLFSVLMGLGLAEAVAHTQNLPATEAGQRPAATHAG